MAALATAGTQLPSGGDTSATLHMFDGQGVACRSVIRVLTRTAAGVLLAALLAFPLDWMVWRARVADGGGMSSVTLSRFTVARLKGNKEEYYFDGTEPSNCSRSLFPQAGAGACWWLRRHAEVLVRY